MRSSEPSFAIQIEPSRLASTPVAASFGSPSDDDVVTTRASRKLSRPFEVPTHTMPSRSSNIRCTLSLDRPSERP